MNKKYSVIILMCLLIIGFLPMGLGQDTFSVIRINDVGGTVTPNTDLLSVVWDLDDISDDSNGSRADYALMGGEWCTFWEWQPGGNEWFDMRGNLVQMAFGEGRDISQENVTGLTYNDTDTYLLVTGKDNWDSSDGTSAVFNHTTSTFLDNDNDPNDIEWIDIKGDSSGNFVLIGNNSSSSKGEIYWWSGYPEKSGSNWVNLDTHPVDGALLGGDKPFTLTYNNSDSNWYFFVWNQTNSQSDVYSWDGNTANDISKMGTSNYTLFLGADFSVVNQETILVGLNFTNERGQTLIYDPSGDGGNGEFYNITSDDTTNSHGYNYMSDVKYHPTVSPAEAIMVGFPNFTFMTYGIYKYTSGDKTNTFQDSGLSPSLQFMYALEWEPVEGLYALIVGGGGVVLQYFPGSSGDQDHTVEVEAENSPAVISDVSFVDSDNKNMINRQLDPEGTYTISFSVEDTNTWEDIGDDGRIRVAIWYDMEDDTKDFQYYYLNNEFPGSNYYSLFQYKDDSIDPTSPDEGECDKIGGNAVLDQVTINEETANQKFTFSFEFTMNSWMKYASDPVNTGNSGVDYGYNDEGSWNIIITVFDGVEWVKEHNLSNGDAMEFGLYRYTSLDIQNGVNWEFASGEPGDTVWTHATSAPNFGFVSNDDFDLRVWLKEEFNDGEGHTIPSSNIRLSSEGDAKASKLAIFDGTGDGKFGLTGGTAEPMGVVSGDFDQDGNLDLATADASTDEISVFLGKGDLSFETAVQYGAGTQPCNITAGDFDKDGNLDLVTADYGSNTLSVFLGNGDGTFQNAVAYNTGTNPIFVITQDLNGDGFADLASADYGDDQVSVLPNQGDGTFFDTDDPQYATYAVSDEPMCLAAGYFNADNDIDLVTADAGAMDQLTILLSDGDGTFSPGNTYLTSGDPHCVVVDDFNMDGDEDMAVALFSSSQLAFYFGDGTGSFTMGSRFGIGNSPINLTVSDINRDNIPDMTITNLQGGLLAVIVNTGNGNFRLGDFIILDEYMSGTYSGDLNNDQREDLIVLEPENDRIRVLRGLGDGEFTISQKHEVVGSYPKCVISGDFNEDGMDDLVSADSEKNQLSYLQGNGDGTFRSATTIAVGEEPVNVSTGDLNGDNHLDLVSVDAASSQLSVVLGNGDGTFQSAVAYGVEAVPNAVVAVDLNSDTKLDLISANFYSNKVSVLKGVGDGTFEAAVHHEVGDNPYSLTAGDFNGDNKIDIMCARVIHDEIVFLEGDDNCGFTGINPILYPNKPSFVESADLNSDNKLDLICSELGSSKIIVYLGDGTGSFPTTYSYPISFGAMSVEITDLNEDNKLDLVSANRDSDNLSIYLGVGDGTFLFDSSVQAGPSPYWVSSGNFDQDSAPELVTADYLQGNAFEGIGMGHPLGYMLSNSMGRHAGEFSNNQYSENRWAPNFELDIPIGTYHGTYSATLICTIVQIL